MSFIAQVADGRLTCSRVAMSMMPYHTIDEAIPRLLAGEVVRVDGVTGGIGALADRLARHGVTYRTFTEECHQ